MLPIEAGDVDRTAMKRVVLAMSGGVDSSVAAYLLREAGYEVIGLFMRSGATLEPLAVDAERTGGLLPILSGSPAVAGVGGGGASHKKGCCSAQDAADARRVADKLDIPFYALDFHEDFGRIMDYFADEYTSGRTPNPCVMCNNWLKFGKLWSYARQVQADYVATGHYARIEPQSAGLRIGDGGLGDGEGRERSAEGGAGRAQGYRLLRAVDTEKDQSYVLFGLRRELLPHILFPVGGYTKDETRAVARRLELRVAGKPDSQEICFVPQGGYAEFVRSHRPESVTAGEIIDTQGQILGEHAGIENFTVGQRRGLGVALGEARYVVALEPHTRRVVIGTREELARPTVDVDDTNWLVDEPANPVVCQVKIRYRHASARGVVAVLPDRRARIRFEQPQLAVAPGQAAVFYDGVQVLGGGWIR